jgi:tRNA(Ile)-lysidine synthase
MDASSAFQAKFRAFCRRRRLFGEHQKLIVAVSGGVDSAVMLDLLKRESGVQLCVAHFNHCLRGPESEADEMFVRAQAERDGLDFYVERADTAAYARAGRMGIQDAARALRYAFLENLLVSTGFDRITTGHTADDNAETVLLNLFRGAGVQGLSGIPVFRKDTSVIRPLLFATRAEIETYARDNEIAFRSDSSNEKDDYRRNFIRHRIVEVLRNEGFPAIVPTLQRTADLFRELEIYLTHHARQVLELAIVGRTQETLHLSIGALKGNPVMLQQYVVLMAIEEFAGVRPDAEAVGRVLRLVESGAGAWVPLFGDQAVYRDRDSLVFRRGDQLPEFRIVVQQNHRYEFGTFRFSTELLDGVPDSLNGDAEYVDADRVTGADLVLRTWTNGDAFIPLGMHDRKKVSDFFIDAKVPVYEKRHFPVLETREGEIVWLCGLRIDERFKVTEDTRRVLKLQYARASRIPHGKTSNG